MSKNLKRELFLLFKMSKYSLKQKSLRIKIFAILLWFYSFILKFYSFILKNVSRETFFIFILIVSRETFYFLFIKDKSLSVKVFLLINCINSAILSKSSLL